MEYTELAEYLSDNGEIIKNSYGFRPDRCAQRSVMKALEMMNEGHNWIVDNDLERFFDTVNHDKRMTRICEGM